MNDEQVGGAEAASAECCDVGDGPPAVENTSIIKAGWMTKQGGSRKSWRKRWFVLRNHTLSYYKDASDSSPLGIISLQGCSVSPTDAVKKPHCFQVYHPVRRTFYMYPSTRMEQDQWIQCIRSQIPKQDGTSTYNVVMLGAGGVGKSALTLQFVNNVFLVDYEPTIEDSFLKQMSVDNISCRISILDTAGQEEYATITDQYIDVGQGFIICFDLTTADSLHDAAKIYQKVRRSHEDAPRLPVLLVGNKCDLLDKRAITEAECRAEASRLGCPYFETSALTRHNVENVFHEIVRMIRANEAGVDPEAMADKKCLIQ